MGYLVTHHLIHISNVL
ncbi:unnamed protein product [Callosobruchus maculatus]|uniref:Uncharacterized protein n=1 Tax=Callosobruchus maculatus TaxID=64391 RepID=A0A653CK96_CALMS|nr:unnamed protein product [Callosobruchus maculatus]